LASISTPTLKEPGRFVSSPADEDDGPPGAMLRMEIFQGSPPVTDKVIHITRVRVRLLELPAARELCPLRACGPSVKAKLTKAYLALPEILILCEQVASLLIWSLSGAVIYPTYL
jgi:hypothetical protein